MFRYGGLALFLAALCYVAVDSYAEPFQTITIGEKHTTEFLYEDSYAARHFKWTSSPDRINNNGVWQDYILTETANTLKLETANSGSFIFNKDYCSYNLFNGGIITNPNSARIKDISWTVKGKAAASSTWSNVNSINNAACSVTVQSTQSTVKLIGEKSSSAGIFQIVLDYSPGMGIKETFRAYNNNPAWTNHNIGFTETFEVPPIIHFGGQEYDLTQYNNTILGRTWIENNQAKLVKLSEKIIYDFGIGFENLNDIKITYIDGKTKLSLNYLYPTQTVPYQSWFEVDPTFGYTTGNFYFAQTTSGANCGSITAYTAGNTGQLAVGAAGNNCYRTSSEWDVSSLPAGITATNTNLRIDNTAGPAARVCDINSMEFRPSTQAVSSLWGDIGNGTTYVNNAAFCQSTSSNTVIDLGTSADSSITSIAGNRVWWAAGFKYDSELSDGANHDNLLAQPELEITYVYPVPNPPTSMTAQSVFTQTQYGWTQTNGTGTAFYIIGRSLDNMTWPQSEKIVTGNVTSYLDSDPYCSFGATCYVNVTAANVSYNSTLSSYASYVMDYPPDAITDLVVTGITPTTITVSFTPPNFHGHTLIGYQVNYTTPLCSK